MPDDELTFKLLVYVREETVSSSAIYVYAISSVSLIIWGVEVEGLQNKRKRGLVGREGRQIANYPKRHNSSFQMMNSVFIF